MLKYLDMIRNSFFVKSASHILRVALLSLREMYLFEAKINHLVECFGSSDVSVKYSNKKLVLC